MSGQKKVGQAIKRLSRSERLSGLLQAKLAGSLRANPPVFIFFEYQNKPYCLSKFAKYKAYKTLFFCRDVACNVSTVRYFFTLLFFYNSLKNLFLKK
jgi:hypothetical protein